MIYIKWKKQKKKKKKKKQYVAISLLKLCYFLLFHSLCSFIYVLICFIIINAKSLTSYKTVLLQ